MKSICLNTTAALALACTAAACSIPRAIPSATREVSATLTLSPTISPVQPTIGVTSPAAFILPPIKRLSPSSFEKDGVVFEVFAFVRLSCLKFDIQITSERPVLPPSTSNSFEPVEQIQFLNGSTGAPLTVALVGRGGGGGGGAPNIPYLLSWDFLYDVKSPLPIPAIIALVTFHPSLGIHGPARFDIQPTVRPNLGCPQLPPTTPEG